MNPNNPNTGGKGVTDIRPYLTDQVVSDNPDQRPDTTGVGHVGSSTPYPSPAGREAQPKPKKSGWGDVRIAG